MRARATVIDRESVQTVNKWLRMGDGITGRQPIEGRCDRCGGNGYLTVADSERLCARCYLGRSS